MVDIVKQMMSLWTSTTTELKKNSTQPSSEEPKVKIEDGFYIWQKGEVFKLGNNFSTKEFSCHCHFPDCKTQKIHVDIIDKLDNIRSEIKQPLYVTSGYRCQKHQAFLRSAGLKTAKNLSQHELGQAVDIVPKDQKNIRTSFLTIVEKQFNSIGLSDNFLHCDLRTDHRRWEY